MSEETELPDVEKYRESIQRMAADLSSRICPVIEKFSEENKPKNRGESTALGCSIDLTLLGLYARSVSHRGMSEERKKERMRVSIHSLEGMFKTLDEADQPSEGT